MDPNFLISAVVCPVPSSSVLRGLTVATSSFIVTRLHNMLYILFDVVHESSVHILFVAVFAFMFKFIGLFAANISRTVQIRC